MGRCIKCGKETQEGHVFCEDCLAVMDAYPVKPDAAIHLPNRQEAAPKKAVPRKRVLTPEEQVERLKKANRRLRWYFLLLLLLFAASLAAVAYLAYRAGLLPWK